MSSCLHPRRQTLALKGFLVSGCSFRLFPTEILTNILSQSYNLRLSSLCWECSTISRIGTTSRRVRNTERSKVRTQSSRIGTNRNSYCKMESRENGSADTRVVKSTPGITEQFPLMNRLIYLLPLWLIVILQYIFDVIASRVTQQDVWRVTNYNLRLVRMWREMRTSTELNVEMAMRKKSSPIILRKATSLVLPVSIWNWSRISMRKILWWWTG